METVWSAGVVSASDTAVLGSVSDGDDAVEIEASSPNVVVVPVPLSGRIAAADDVAATNGCAFWISPDGTKHPNANGVKIIGDLEKLPACPNRDVDSENTYKSKGEQTRIIWRQFLGNRRLVAIFRGPL